MKPARRDRWLVAAGVVVMLVALVVVGRLQAGSLPEGDAAGSQPTTSRVRTDASPVASRLGVAGRVALSGPAAAVAVGWDPAASPGSCWSRAVCCGSTPTATG